jgi:zinc-ribbon domain
LSQCANCGRQLPEGALFCPDCGAKTLDYTVAQTDLSPSNFNSGVTSTAQPQTTVTPEGEGYAGPPPVWPEEKKRPSLMGRRGFVLTVIIALAILLVGVSLEAGMLRGGAPAVNSANDPMSGQQLYQAFAANLSQADASYANRTVYIQDSVDFGVRLNSLGQYFSTVNSGSVVLIWSDQAQVSQLSPGDSVLAKCSVAGPVREPGGGYLVYLENCDLISTQSQATTASETVSVANL